MFKQTVFSGFTNVVPFWSHSLIQVLNLGVEYNIVLNMMLNELLRQATEHLAEEVLLGMLVCAFACLLYRKFGGQHEWTWFRKNVVVVEGKEVTACDETTVVYCDKIQALNDYLLKKTTFRSVTYVDDLKFLMNDVQNFPVAPGLYLNIGRTQLGNNGAAAVRYQLWSYYADVQAFLDRVTVEHKSASISEMTLIGDESNQKIAYPAPIHAINQFVFLHCDDFPRFKCMMQMTNRDLLLGLQESGGSSGGGSDNNKAGNAAGKSGGCGGSSGSGGGSGGVAETIKNKLKTAGDDYSYTLDNVCNYRLGDVFITIHRQNSMVYYTLKSNQVRCKDWLEAVVREYSQTKYSKFKRNLRLCGRQEVAHRANLYKRYYYTKEMWALNWLLIEVQQYQNYECVNGVDACDNDADHKTVSANMYPYTLEPVELYKVEEDLYLTVIREETKRPWESASNKTLYNNDCNMVYILQSNHIDLKVRLGQIVEAFGEYNKKKTVNKVLYHFSYCGLKKGELEFNTRILSEENTDRQLYETFDKLHNENVEPLQTDLDQLKDVEYYRKHGLKRKKGYLFYGVPGCGKTSAVVAMALYDSRHIVEIPFSLLTEHDEFERIMNLQQINNIDINNNNIILLFDEIDIGMERVGQRKPDGTSTCPPNNTSEPGDFELVHKAVKSYFSDNTEADAGSTTLKQKINLATLLSRLDGIGNYNGLVIVGTTNCLAKLDPALYRELRLTPMLFRELRVRDVIAIVRSYFGSDYNADKLHELLKDRAITPTKLISLCQLHHAMDVTTFFTDVLGPYFGKAWMQGQQQLV